MAVLNHHIVAARIAQQHYADGVERVGVPWAAPE
jgi:hypothetical protein